jgi:ribose transport system permease protein
MNASVFDAAGGRTGTSAFERIRPYGIFIAVAVVAVVAAAAVPGFASWDNLRGIVRSVAYVGMVATGMTLVVIAGKMVDLSVPVAIAGAAILAIRLQPHGVALSLLAALALPLLLGLVNGLVCGLLQVNAVVGTLATATVGGGLILFLTDNGEFSYGSNAAFHAFGTTYVLGLPPGGWAMAAMFVLGHLLLRHTRYGAYLYATGANYHAARASGVPVRRVIAVAFVLTSLAGALAGVLIAADANIAAFQVANGYEFDALSAVLIGGASLGGGLGSMPRTLAGVVFVGVVGNVMVLAGAAYELQLIAKGALIVLAVGLDNRFMSRFARSTP